MGSTNFLGLEIRQQLVEAARQDVEDYGMVNVNFCACNANVNFEHLLLRAAPQRPLQSVSIQFPDPWFKARHKKRRVVQPELVESIVRHLPINGWLFVQTDVLELAEDIRDTVSGVDAAACLCDVQHEPDNWDAPKPELLQDVATERERSCAELERPVYRRLYTKR